MSLYRRTLDTFLRHFEDGLPPRLFRAPGRVNLIGEHTDYNDGFVLPVAIDRQVVVAARLRSDTQVNVYSLDFAQWSRFGLGESDRDSQSPWGNYVHGVAWSLQRSGYRLSGMDAVVAGDVPLGAGLSSSAALEVAAGYTFLRLTGNEVDHVALALAAQRAENEFVGMRCGIMDQFAVSLGQADHALLIDCRDLSYRTVSVPEDAAIVIADSGVRRGLVDSEYNARRSECEAAARFFKVAALRDVDESAFDAKAHSLPAVMRKRARHVITENARTLAAVQALEKRDLATFGHLMDASHTSLRDDFEVSCKELDLLVEIARSVEGIYGARLTGAGFGGCIVALAHRDVADDVASAIHERYPSVSGREAMVYICQAANGVSEVPW